MKPLRDPHLVIALILLLVAVAFLGGTLRLIRSARAAETAPVITSNTAGLNIKSAVDQRGDHFAQALTPTEEENSPVVQGSTTPLSADTGGIIALAIVIVVTILLGAVVGVRATSPKKPSPK